MVTGIRASLQRASELKKRSDQVMDVITADDVGKLPDANVAEALQRVTGVQITRVFGEGQAVSVRGLQQVRVEIDGRTLLGWSARLSPPENDQLGRSSGLDSVPSGLFGKLEVQKSAMASQVEGGLSGVVNLVTPKPFDFKTTTATARVQGVYSEASKKFEPTATALFSTRFAGDRLGLLVSGEYQKRTSVLQGFERNNFLNRNYTAAGVTMVLPTPVLLRYENFLVDRTRYGVNAALQFRATPDLLLTAEALYSHMATSRKQEQLTWRLGTGTNPVDNAVVDNGFVVAGNGIGTIQSAGTLRDEPTDNYLYSIRGEYSPGRLKIFADAYYAKGTLDQTLGFINLNQNNVAGAFDFRGGNVPSLTLGTTARPFDPASPASYIIPQANTLSSARLLGLLDEWTGRLDGSYEVNDAITLHMGGRYTKLHGRVDSYTSNGTVPAADFAARTRVTDGEDFLRDVDGNFPRSFLTTTFSKDYAYRIAQAGQPNPDPNDKRSQLLPNTARNYDLRESALAGYFMVSAKQDFGSVPVRANFGVRVVSTRLSVDSYLRRSAGAITTFTLVNDKSRYTNILPSANVTVQVTDKLQTRLAASQTLQRASIADLAPSTFYNETNLTVSGGNAALKPPLASNIDLSVEYYPGGTSQISGAVFYKDVKDFIANDTISAIFPGGPAFPIPTTRPFNIGSAKVKGFEVGIQTFLTFLPTPLDGFGVIGNYTFSDSKDNNGFPLVAVSKNSYNLIGLYEKGGVSARLAYNYRDDAVFEFSEGRPSYIGPRSQLDAQISYDFNDALQLQLQAQNLNPKGSATREYSVFPGAINTYTLSERRYAVGLRAKF